MSTFEHASFSDATAQVVQQRGSTQYTQGAKLIELWSPVFEIDSAWLPHSISLCLGIDDLFEDTPIAQLPLLHQRLNALVAERVITWDTPITSLSDAIAFYLVFFNYHVSHRLRSDSEWFDLWYHTLDRHHTHQIAHRCFSGEPEADHFKGAIDEYITRFEYTAGFSLNVLSLLPFSPRYDPHWLTLATATLRRLDQLYRVAQDVRVDLDESLNLGIFAYAAEQGVDCAIALDQLRLHPEQTEVIEARLHEHFEQLLNRCQIELQSDDPIWQLFTERALVKVQRIRGRWR